MKLDILLTNNQEIAGIQLVHNICHFARHNTCEHKKYPHKNSILSRNGFLGGQTHTLETHSRVSIATLTHGPGTMSPV